MKYTDQAFKSLNFCEKKEDAVHPDLLNQLYFSSDITETKKNALFGKVYAIELIKNKKPKKKPKKTIKPKKKQKNPLG